MRLFREIFKKNIEKNPSTFEDIIDKLNDSFTIKKYDVNPQVQHEKKTDIQNLD